jgi:fused signal recognition particle receptor
MGLFSKIKDMFKKYDDSDEKKTEEVAEEQEDEEEFEETYEESENMEEEQEDELDEEIEEDSEKEDEEDSDDFEEETEEIVEEQEIEEESEEVDESKEEKKEKKGLFGLGKKKTKEEIFEEEKKSVKIYEKGLTKSRKGFVSKLANLTNKYSKVTDEYFEELEEILIMADIGVNTVMEFIDRLRDRVDKEHISDPSELKEIIVDELFIIYVNDEVLSSHIQYNENGPTVILFIGVNGVGKTTTIGKIAYKLKNEGKKVLMVGADTFRAGAVEQLKEWSDKVDVGFYGKEDSDPASVVYDGIELAKKEEYDVVLIDTAGRLQNKVNLMKELEKINKVIDGLVDGGATETLLVVDATTGQNGISQAKAFKEITNITGIILTKLDGTAKGGIVLAIKESVGIPVKYIGLGETKDDLQAFDIEKYIYGLFKDMM